MSAEPKITTSLGFANLAGEDLEPLASADFEVLSPLFADIRRRPPFMVPPAGIIFLYAHLNEDGTIRADKRFGVRQVIQATGAQLLVLASENPDSALIKAGGIPGPKTANIVLTNNRNGEGFGKFFRALFMMMRDGKNMLEAWVLLAPQMPRPPSWLPGTILLPEAGRLAFPPPKL
ncbi:MAG TPA: hypothetical protein VL971_09850 [Rhizomicrobium sp.]|nr:hypothetical protein [Rhizomicrobium sp.]